MHREPEQLNRASATVQDYTLEDIMKEFGKAEEAPKRKVTSGTIIFTPVKTDAPQAQEEAPMKVVHSTREIPATPMHTGKEAPIKIYDPPEEAPPEKPHTLLKESRRRIGAIHIQRLFLAFDMVLGLFVALYSASGWQFFPLFNKAGFWIPIGLLLLALIFSYPVFWQGLRDLLRLRVSLYSLGSIAAVLCVIYSFSYHDALYAPLVVVQLFYLLRGILNEKTAHLYTARTVCSFQSPMGVCNAPQLLENTDSLRRDSGNIEEFMQKLSKSSLPQDLLCVYASILLPLLPCLSYLLSHHSGLPFVQVWLLLLLCAIPCAGMLCYAKPFSVLAKRLSTYGGALCGWHGAQIFGGKHTIIIRDEDLFPRANISSNGMKLYGAHKAERVISYALAALKAANSPLVDLFETLLAQQYGKHSHISEHRCYDHGGVGVEIGNDIVLVGSLSFMRSMGVHMPAGTRVRQAIYVSINGELAGIFAIKYKPSNSTRAGLHDVLANHNFAIVLATRDFLITPELIAAKYALPTDTMVFPDYTERLRLSQTNPEQALAQGALIAKDTFGAFAITVAAGRTLRITALSSVALALFAGILGLIVCILLIAWNAVAVASPLHIASFQLLWAFMSGFVSYILLKF